MQYFFCYFWTFFIIAKQHVVDASQEANNEIDSLELASTNSSSSQASLRGLTKQELNANLFHRLKAAAPVTIHAKAPTMAEARAIMNNAGLPNDPKNQEWKATAPKSIISRLVYQNFSKIK